VHDTRPAKRLAPSSPGDQCCLGSLIGFRARSSHSRARTWIEAGRGMLASQKAGRPGVAAVLQPLAKPRIDATATPPWVGAQRAAPVPAEVERVDRPRACVATRAGCNMVPDGLHRVGTITNGRSPLRPYLQHFGMRLDLWFCQRGRTRHRWILWLPPPPRFLGRGDSRSGWIGPASCGGQDQISSSLPAVRTRSAHAVS